MPRSPYVAVPTTRAGSPGLYAFAMPPISFDQWDSDVRCPADRVRQALVGGQQRRTEGLRKGDVGRVVRGEPVAQLEDPREQGQMPVSRHGKVDVVTYQLLCSSARDAALTQQPTDCGCDFDVGERRGVQLVRVLDPGAQPLGLGVREQIVDERGGVDDEPTGYSGRSRRTRSAADIGRRIRVRRAMRAKTSSRDGRSVSRSRTSWT